MTERARAFPALVATSAWIGLAVQFSATLGTSGSAGAALWIIARYFTILINLAVALAFSALALRGRPGSPAVMSGVTLNILLVAIVYHLLLAGTLAQTPPEKLADLFLHSLTPALVMLFWLARVPRGALRYPDVVPWAAAPLGYFAYALARGTADATYPYPFMDVGRIGWAATAINAALIASGFLMAGLGLVWFDRRLGGRAPRA